MTQATVSAPMRKRMGRPPGGGPPKINWNDAAQVREYKAQQMREYAAQRRPELQEKARARYAKKYDELRGARVKPCSNPSPPNHEPGVEMPFDRFYPDPRKVLGVASQCKDCKDAARKLRSQTAAEIERRKGTYRKARQLAIAVYGGRCVQCGVSDSRENPLEFDHVNDDGGRHRKVETGQQMVRRIAATGHRIDEWELQLLCLKHHKQKTRGARIRAMYPQSGWGCER